MKKREKAKLFEPIYTRDEAARIVEMFENILVENEISIPSPEDDDRDPDDTLGLYGSVYSNLLDSVENVLVRIIIRRGPHGDHIKDLNEVITWEFSGNY